MPKKAKRADGRYSVQVYLGRDENGKRIIKTVYGSTQKEVDKKASELKIKLGKGIDLRLEKDTFDIWRERWLTFKKSEVSESHYINLCSTCKHLDCLAHKRIGDIVPWDIKELLASLAKENPNTGKPASKKLLTDIKSIASQIFVEAIDNRAIEFNPAQNVKIPKTATIEKREPILEEQIEWIKDTEHRAQPAAMLMLFAGLRRGEVVALSWRDVDLSNNIISVRRSVEYQRNTPVLKYGAKSKAGIRNISIPDILSDYLSTLPKNSIYVMGEELMTAGAWKRMWESYMVTLDAKYGKRVFDKERKCRKNLPVAAPVSKFDPYKGAMVIRPFTAHQLRHTYATMLYDAGVDVLSAQYLLGHSDLSTTMTIYTHLSEEKKMKSVSALNDYFSFKSGSSQKKTENA